jgi:asparagine N-glycosylation enzyme membrane subunit Stt3
LRYPLIANPENQALKKGTVRGIVAAYVLLFLLSTTWPGATLFNTVEPMMLGLPFNLFVLASLIAVALLVLWALYISETRSED